MIALTEGNTLSLKREGKMTSRGELRELWFSVSFLGQNKEDTRRAMSLTTKTRIRMTPITAITKNGINKDKDEDEEKEEGSGDYYGSSPGDKDGEDEDKDKHDYDYDLYL